MRHLLSVFLLCSISSAFLAQDTIATYFDWAGNPTKNSEGAVFFRSKINPSKPTKTYYFGDSLIKNDAFTRSQISEKNGRFIFINQTETVIGDVTFKDNKRDGQSLSYYGNGKIKDVEFFKNGLQDSVSTYYHKNGAISAIERYELDSLISYEFFNEDGTKDSITTSAEILAEFPGGRPALLRFLGESIVYPQIAQELGIQGKCFLQFLIDEKGNISNVKVMRGVPDCEECDKESVRVIKSMPLWTPAKIHNRYCSSTFFLPISYKLAGEETKKKRRNR
jgi:protein TonB